MTKGYTLEVINREERRADYYHFSDLKELELERELYHAADFCIVTEWAQFDDGLGNYEKEIARYNW